MVTRSWSPGRRGCRVYSAEDRAASRVPVVPLDGTRKAAQAYVDRITRSAWWKRTCPPSWLGMDGMEGECPYGYTAVPRRVIVREGRGAGGWAEYGKRRYRGWYFPTISLGRVATPWCFVSPLADPWIILHELAHVMTCAQPGERGHGAAFARTFLGLVRRWLGPEAAAELRAAYKAEGVKWRAVAR